MADEYEAPETRIYSLGLDRQRKAAILTLVPQDQQDEARGLVRTGEEVAVIFAKISRNPGSFQDIAKEVDEEGAASFHGKWTVSVEGYGHASVGEHAIIQLAVENISSADGDALTDNRLASFTEFSARFKGRQSMGFFVPASVLADPRLRGRWMDVHGRLFAACDELTQKGRAWIVTDEAREAVPQVGAGYYKEGETPGAWRARVGKHAADQYKNMLPASRLTSMGVTMNATEAENVLKKLLSSQSRSTREMGSRFKEAALEVTPTLVKYADWSPYLASMERRREAVLDIIGRTDSGQYIGREDARTIVVTSADPEALMLAAFAFESTETGSYQDLLRTAENLNQGWKDTAFGFVLGLFTSSGLGPHDKPPRAFEFDGGYIYEFPDMTYGDWRDYKRHRMQSYIAKPLDIKWGYLIPPMAQLMDMSADASLHGCVELFRESIDEMEELFQEVAEVNLMDAKYAVTRAHYRPAIARFNIREAFHLLRLRTGDTAHPSVRRLMWPTYDILMERHPNITKHMNLRGERTKIAFP